MFKLFAVLLLAVTVFGYPAVEVDTAAAVDTANLKLDEPAAAVAGPIAKEILSETGDQQKDDKDLEKSETLWGGWGGFGYRTYYPHYYPRYYNYGWSQPRYYGGWGNDYYW